MGQMNFSVEGSKPDNPSVNRSKLYPKSDGWYRLDSSGNEVKLADLDDFDVDISLRGNYYVSKSGNDSTGDGSISKPFLTIGACITYINANDVPSVSNNLCIMVSAGEYIEGALILPRFCSLWGTQYRTRVTASSGSINLITAAGAHTIKDILLTGVTNSENYLISAVASQTTRLLLNGVAMNAYESGGNISNGINITATSGLYTVELETVDFGDVTGSCITIGSKTNLQLRGAQLFNCASATFLETTSDASYSLSSIHTDDDGVAVGLNHGNTGSSSIADTNLRLAVIPIIKSNSGELLIQNTAIASANAQITNFEGLKGFFFDEVEGEDTLRILNELSVGLPEFGGYESCFGEGDSTSLGVKVYTYDGATYTDVSTAAVSSSDSTFTFSGSGSTREIYISILRKRISTNDYLTFQGIKTEMVTAASSDGEFVAEFWNGSSWVEFNTMSSEASGNHYPFAKQLFERTGAEQVRYPRSITDSWEKNDPASIGVNTYWMRFRAETIPTTLPVFEYLKVHTNRTEINEGGYIEYFGEARPVLSLCLPNFESANNSPNNQDLYFQDNFGVGKQENLFVDGSVDQSSQIVYLPASVCTSCPLRLKAVLVCTGNSTASSSWTIRWIINKEGDEIYPDTANAPSSNPNVQSRNVSISPTGENEQFTLEADLDISDYIADNENGTPDVLGIQIQRNGNSDSNDDDIALAAVNVFYTKVNEGSHL